MELHQVRYFLALCQEKNFTRAAKRCGVSQPSLSNAIRRLEQELGGHLFHRSRVNCPLSELGQEVWPHLAKLDQCAHDARRQAARFFDRATGLGRSLGTGAIDQQANHPRQFGIHLVNPEQQEGHKMRKPIYSIGACALVAAGAIFVWSHNALVPSRANVASAFLLPHRSPLVAEAATTLAMSPTEMMINYNRPLPVEQWDGF